MTLLIGVSSVVGATGLTLIGGAILGATPAGADGSPCGGAGDVTISGSAFETDGTPAGTFTDNWIQDSSGQILSGTVSSSVLGTAPLSGTCEDVQSTLGVYVTDTISFVPDGADEWTISIEGTWEYEGLSGYFSGSGELIGTLVAPSISVTDNASSGSPLQTGDTLEFVAVVSGDEGTPTGDVSWSVTGPNTPSCGDVGLDGSGTATCTIANALAGTYVASASYGGDSTYSSASSDEDQVDVAKAASSVVVTDDGPVDLGAVLTFTATIYGVEQLAPTGSPTWDVSTPGGQSIPCASTTGPDVSGDAATYTCSVTESDQGAYSASAEYPGDANFSASSGFDPGTGPHAAEQGDALPNPSEDPVTCSGCPINTSTGSFFKTFDDLSVPGRGVALDLSRTYASGDAGVKGPLGYGWSDSYDMSLATDASGSVTVTQENGSTVTFTPNGSGGFVAPSRVLATLVANPNSTYTFTRDQSQVRYNFSATGKLMAETDLNGYVTSLSYAGGNLSKVTDAAGRSLIFTYGRNGLVSSVTDPAGRTVSFAYDSSDDLVKATNAAGKHWTFTYGANHLMLTMTDPRGGATTNSYSGSGQVLVETDPQGRTTSYSYAPSGADTASTSETDPLGHVTLWTYGNGMLLSVTRASGTTKAATQTYTYDPETLGVATATDPDGRATSYTYDAAGNVLTKTDPLGRTTTSTYNAFNEPLTVTDPMGVTTTSTYDGNGNLLTTTVDGRTTTDLYGDPSHPGDVTGVTDPLGNTTTYTYDADGDQTSVRDPDGHTTTAAYDSIGRKLSSTDPNGGKTIYTYDPLGDVLTTTDPLGHATTDTYDADQNLTSVTDPSGNVTKNVYDADNELLSTKTSKQSTTYTYDGDGNALTSTDASGHTTRYTYDPLNRKVSTTDPLGHATTSTYDPAGNLLTTTDPSGRVTTNTYDADNELTSVSYSDGTTSNVSYVYDADGHRTSMTDGTGTTSYTYDAVGELTSSTDGSGSTVGYTYDADGHTASITYPNGEIVTEAYDPAGLETSLNDGIGHTSTFTYDADDNLISETLGSTTPVSDTSTYNADNALTSITDVSDGSTLQAFTYTRNTDSLVSSAAQSGQPTIAYSYDNLNELTADGQGSYSYNSAASLTKLPGVQTLAYNADDELTSSAVKKVGTTSYSYDVEGERSSTKPPTGPASTYDYDQAGDLTSFSQGSTAATYSYNGDGLRMAKTVNGATTTFTWDTAASTQLLSDGSTNYIYGPDGSPIEQTSSTGEDYLHHDQLGSTTMLTNDAGTPVATYGYNSYGELAWSAGSATTPLLYDGQYRDAESGFYYLRARYYDPTTGQFTSVDPALSLSRMPYSYGSNDPSNAVDESGLMSYLPILGVTPYSPVGSRSLQINPFVAGEPPPSPSGPVSFYACFGGCLGYDFTPGTGGFIVGIGTPGNASATYTTSTGNTTSLSTPGFSLTTTANGPVAFNNPSPWQPSWQPGDGVSLAVCGSFHFGVSACSPPVNVTPSSQCPMQKGTEITSPSLLMGFGQTPLNVSLPR